MTGAPETRRLHAVPGVHEASPKPGTAFSDGGPNAGRPVDPGNPMHYPAEALCGVCGEVIRRQKWLAAADGGDWEHTGRKPGDPR